jgi:predicted dehydrogenase
MPIRFAAIGINHNHILGQVDALLKAGAEFVSFHAPEDELALPFAERYPQARRVSDKRRILEDDGIALVVSAGINADRAPLGIDVMLHGKEYMTDKPGATTLEQLADIRQVQAETGRIYSICYSEHFQTRSTVKAGELVQAGAIGQVINTVGLGPHRLNAPSRPGWFFDRAKTGSILTDLASHQCEQFLFFTGAADAQVLSATVANRANRDYPGLDDFGDMILRAEGATGYIRVDWFTPAGLPTWGDGRIVIMGTEGTIELRKYLDIAGRPGIDHLFLSDGKGVQYIDCAGVELPYGRQLVHDILNRTATAMPQAHCFKAMEIALTAQSLAEAASKDKTQ